MLKTILVSLTGLNGDRSALETAVAAAGLEGAHIDALHVHAGIEEVLALAVAEPLPHSPALIKLASDIRRSERERTDRARSAFEDACRQHQISIVDHPQKLDQRSAAWIDVESDAICETARRAQYYDLTILSREVQLPPEHLSDILMRSGRPILIAPPRPGIPLGQTVAIAWKPTPEASRALVAAAPFLARAKKVVLFSVPDDGGCRESLQASQDAIKSNLSWSGIAVETQLSDAAADAAGIIRETANNLGADLLVMGAYGHSRLREVVFGGVTRSMLSSCDIPVLMVH
jgi:nucleotide-binding universal stress UspA family protein